MAKIGHYPTENSQKLKRTDLGVELIRLLSSEGHAIFSIEQAREFSPRIGLKESYLRESLYHLRRNGWLLPLRRGLYAISPTVPGVTPSHEFVIAMALKGVRHDDSDRDSPSTRTPGRPSRKRISCRRGHLPIHPSQAGTVLRNPKDLDRRGARVHHRSGAHVT